MRIRSIGNIIVFILLLFEKSTTSNCEILIQPTGGLFMSSVFYRFEHSSPAVRGRKTCNSRTFVFFLRAAFGKCEHALHLFELTVLLYRNHKKRVLKGML